MKKRTQESVATMDDDLAYQFADLGDHVLYYAIASIVSLVPYVGTMAGLVQIIFLFMILSRIKRLNQRLNDPNLEEFRSKIIYGLLVIIVGIVILVISMVWVIIMAIYFMPIRFIGFIFPVFFTGIAVVAFFGLFLEYQAWMKLKVFFKNNQRLFPDTLAKDCLSGTKRIKKVALVNLISSTAALVIIGFLIGALLASLSWWRTSYFPIIMPFIFIILIIGVMSAILVILKATGMFQISHLRNLRFNFPMKMSPTQARMVEDEFPEPQAQPSATSYKFCPHCGNKIMIQGIYCSHCGKAFNE